MESWFVFTSSSQVKQSGENYRNHWRLARRHGYIYKGIAE